MSEKKSWLEMTKEERDILYKQVLSEPQRQVFDLIDKWNVNDTLLPRQNTSKLKNGLLAEDVCEVSAKIRTTLGPIEVYLRSESHLCIPLQLDSYALLYPSLNNYAYEHPRRKNARCDSFSKEVSRAITDMFTFIGVDYTTLKLGKKYAITSAVKELYDYLYDLNLILKNEKRMSSPKDLTHKEASRMYELLVHAFNSVPPLKDHLKPFKATHRTASAEKIGTQKQLERLSADYTLGINVDDEEINRRYDMLSHFCKETDIHPIRGYHGMSPYVDSVLYNIEQSSSAMGNQWRALSDANRKYIKVCLNKKCSQFFDDFYNYTHNIITEEHDNMINPSRPANEDIIWLTKKKTTT